MTDIYLNSGSGKWKRRLVPLLVLIALVATTFSWCRTRTRGNVEDLPDPEATLEPANSSEATATPEPEAPTKLVEVELQDLREMIEAGSLVKAREEALTRLEALPPGSINLELERLIGDLHFRMIQSKVPMDEKVFHVVKSGDTLGKLAQTHGTTIDSIATRNGIRNNVIRIGERLQILTGTFRVEVSKSRNDMVVKLNDRFFKRYRVGTGTDSSTPEGEYVITLRIKHPVWYREDGRQIPYGDPENLLGTHYLKLDIPGIGLHGTWEPDSVGSQSSAGCVRLTNENILELFSLLPEGTSVRITD